MALWEYWERERKRENGHFHSSSLNSSVFYLLESLTWIPRQIWAGLMIVITPVILAFVFAGEWIVELIAARSSLSIGTGCVFVIPLFLWSCQKEWQSELVTETSARMPEFLGALVLVVVATIGLLLLVHVNSS